MVAKMGCPSLGEHTQVEVLIEESYEFKVSLFVCVCVCVCVYFSVIVKYMSECRLSILAALC